MIRNPLLPAKAVDPQPAVSRSIIAYNWLVSWHIWGVRIRTGSCWSVGFGKASLIGARRDSNVSSVKNQWTKCSSQGGFPTSKWQCLLWRSRSRFCIANGWKPWVWLALSKIVQKVRKFFPQKHWRNLTKGTTLRKFCMSWWTIFEFLMTLWN